MSEPGSIFADFQWMGSTLAGFQEAFRAANTKAMYDECIIATGLQTQGVLHIKDLPSKIQMGPQQAVAGGGTSKSGGGTDKVIRYTLLLFYPPVSHKCSNFWQRHHALDAHTPAFTLQLFLDSPFFYLIFHCFWFYFSSIVQFGFFHSGRMSKFLHGQSQAE